MANNDEDDNDKKADEYGVKVFDRVVGWLLIANIAAALLTLNAGLDRKVCDWPAVRNLAALFIGGAFFAFLAQIASAFTWSMNVMDRHLIKAAMTRWKWISDAVIQGGKPPTSKEEALAREQDNIIARGLDRTPGRQARRYISCAALAFVSLVLLGIGILSTIDSDWLDKAVCPTPADTTPPSPTAPAPALPAPSGQTAPATP